MNQSQIETQELEWIAKREKENRQQRRHDLIADFAMLALAAAAVGLICFASLMMQ